MFHLQIARDYTSFVVTLLCTCQYNKLIELNHTADHVGFVFRIFSHIVLYT